MKLLRVRVAVGLALGGLLLWVGCGDNKVAGPNTGDKNHDVTGSQALNAEWLLKSSSAGQSLAGTTWYWEAIERMTFAEPSRVGGDKAYTLTFKEDGTIVAYTWVNKFVGTYTVGSRDADVVYKINIADFYGTESASVGYDGETEWSEGFRSIASFELSGNDLTLYYNNGNASLVYRRLVPSPCLGDGGLSKKNCGDYNSGLRS